MLENRKAKKLPGLSVKKIKKTLRFSSRCCSSSSEEVKLIKVLKNICTV